MQSDGVFWGALQGADIQASTLTGRAAIKALRAAYDVERTIPRPCKLAVKVKRKSKRAPAVYFRQPRGLVATKLNGSSANVPAHPIEVR